jgi:hypothetical protein
MPELPPQKLARPAYGRHPGVPAGSAGMGHATCSSAGACAGLPHVLVPLRAGHTVPALLSAGSVRDKCRPAHEV